ncbi:hypothetical protein AGMMS50212_16400 [Spirochaetia bacterium]|nr:hypothetical protein AGMMS50212_16400 [Spirochaetia bacterium]
MLELYKKIIVILEAMRQMNEQAMVFCQSAGFNGFKRWHRRRARKAECRKLQLLNELYDKYRERALFSFQAVSYSATGLKEHLAAWDALLESKIENVAEWNKEAFTATGSINRTGKKVLCCLLKDREKTGRWYKRFESTGWSVHDMHVLDDHLHEHEKKKEKKE